MPKKMENINTKNKSINNTKTKQITKQITKQTTKKLTQNKNNRPAFLKGGTNIVVATFDVFTSMIKLGETMATEFISIKSLPAQINNASAPVSGQPNTM
jgi:hypothetical protein